MSDDYDSGYYDDYDYDDGYDDDNATSAGGEYDDEYDYDEYEEDEYQTTEFDLDNLRGQVGQEDGNKAEAKPSAGRNWKLIIGVLVGIFVIIPLLCVVATTVLGVATFSAIFSSLEDAQPEVAIATLIPTAEVILPPTATAEPSPTPTLAPPSAEFLSPSSGARLTKGQSVLVELNVQDGYGITSVSLEGSGLAPKSYNGEPSVIFSQNWAPENAGFYTFAVVIRNRLGETNRVEGINVQVIDREFIQRHAATFTTLNTNVALVRGLSLKEPIEPVLMGVEGVKRYFRSEYTPEDAQRDMLVLSSFDFVPRGFNLYDPAVEYSGNSIAGFYDPRSKLFVLVSTDNDLDVYEQYVYIHELMHALQDQHFSLGDLGDTATVPNNDAALALRALAEGEAMLLQERYWQGGYFSAAQ